jgi:hypothetical protein
MGCLYFVPARMFSGRVPDVLRAGDGEGPALGDVGLGHLAGARLSFRPARNNGPDGGAGLVVGLRVSAGETGIFPGQYWQPVAGGDLFVGWPEGEPPGPDDFIREGAINTKWRMTLGDGNTWGVLPTSALPSVLGVDTSGSPARRPRACDQVHFAASEWLFMAVCGIAAGEEVEGTVEEMWARIVDCLATTYHLDFQTGLALGLFEDSLCFRAASTAIGIDLDEKKTAGGGGSVTRTG